MAIRGDVTGLKAAMDRRGWSSGKGLYANTSTSFGFPSKKGGRVFRPPENTKSEEKLEENKRGEGLKIIFRKASPLKNLWYFCIVPWWTLLEETNFLKKN